MSTRFQMGKVQPEAYKAMNALDTYIRTTAVDPIITINAWNRIGVGLNMHPAL